MSTATPVPPNPVPSNPVPPTAATSAGVSSTDRPPADRGDPLAAAALVAAGLLFVAYPALRPYADESTLAGAAAMSSTAWVASHTAGMLAFGLLAAGVSRLLTTPVGGGRRRSAGPLTWLGTLLVLPYYGAETFGLRAIGARAVADTDASLLQVVDAVRFDPTAMTTFAAGLLVLAAAGVAFGTALWPAGGVVRTGGILVAAGLVTYLPQFFLAPAGRVGHGAVLGIGLVMLGAAAARRPMGVDH